MTLDEWSAFHQAAEQLAGMEKNVFDLVYYQGITQVAAAEVLGVAERTVKNYWTQAKLKLANTLKDSDDVA